MMCAIVNITDFCHNIIRSRAPSGPRISRLSATIGCATTARRPTSAADVTQTTRLCHLIAHNVRRRSPGDGIIESVAFAAAFAAALATTLATAASSAAATAALRAAGG